MSKENDIVLTTLLRVAVQLLRECSSMVRDFGLYEQVREFCEFVEDNWLDKRGFVIPWVILAMCIMSIVAASMVSLATLERTEAHAYLTHYERLIDSEGRIQWAQTTVNLDSIGMPLPGVSVHIGKGVILQRWSKTPMWIHEDTAWAYTEQVYSLSHGTVRIYLTGQPTYYYPIYEGPGKPDYHAYACLLTSACWHSPNFGFDTVAASVGDSNLLRAEGF